MSSLILFAIICATAVYFLVTNGKEEERQTKSWGTSAEEVIDQQQNNKKQSKQKETYQDMEVVDMDEEIKKLLTEENMNMNLDRDIAVGDIPFFVPFEQDELLASYLTKEEHDRLYGQLYWYLSNKGIVDRVLKVEQVDTVKQTDQWTGTFFFHLSYDLPEMPVITVVCDYDRYKGYLRPIFTVGYGD